MKKVSSGWILIVVLFVVGAGLIYGANYFTKDKVAEREQDKDSACHKEAFSEAASYIETEFDENFLKGYLKENGISESEIYIDKIEYAKDEEGSIKGIVVTLQTTKGYGGVINMVVGIRNNGTICGYSIPNTSELTGVGFKASQDTFKNQFLDKMVVDFEVVSEEPVEYNEVSDISGASNIARAITKGINATIYTLEYVDGSTGGHLQ